MKIHNETETGWLVPKSHEDFFLCSIPPDTKEEGNCNFRDHFSPCQSDLQDTGNKLHPFTIVVTDQSGKVGNEITFSKGTGQKH